MEKENENSRLHENVDEVVPESPYKEVIRPIKRKRQKLSKGERNALLNKRSAERNRIDKRRKKSKAAKAARKRNRRK